MKKSTKKIKFDAPEELPLPAQPWSFADYCRSWSAEAQPTLGALSYECLVETAQHACALVLVMQEHHSPLITPDIWECWYNNVVRSSEWSPAERTVQITCEEELVVALGQATSPSDRQALRAAWSRFSVVNRAREFLHAMKSAEVRG